MAFEGCKEISPDCPAEGTIYGYYPNHGVNVFFAVFFGVAFLLNVVAGLRWKTWTYMTALCFGAGAEVIGYAGRVLLNGNPWSNTGFEMQICCLIIAPAFLAAGIYLTLKHIVIELGPEYSRLKPKYYTWIFIGCDLLSLILQGAGGGIAATAKTTTNTKAGGHIMLGGIVFQVFTLLIFSGLVFDFGGRLWSNRTKLTQQQLALGQSVRFRLFLGSLTVAFLMIMIRSIYRIAELSQGWASEIMRNEAEFIVLDGVMCVVATLCLTLFHPGGFFPAMQDHNKYGPSKAASYGGQSDPEK